MILEHIIAAVEAVADPYTLVLMAVGVAAGLLAGAIPGFTITMAVILTLPFTFGMDAVRGLAVMSYNFV